MNYSVREAKAHFAEALSQAARGEKVVVTKHGKPFVELIPATPTVGISAEQWAQARERLGLGQRDASWFDEFISNPEASRGVLGIEE